MASRSEAVDRTFLFSDIEGSTTAWEADAGLMAARLQLHDRCLVDAIIACAGIVVKHTGDGVLAVFDSAGSAVAAAVDAQLALAAAEWPASAALQARIGLHTGAARSWNSDWFGPAVNRCARVMDAGHGGQVLCTEETAALARGESPSDVAFVPLGVFRLKDLAEPVSLLQVSHPALRSVFPPLRTLDATAGNLPQRLVRLIGRDGEVRALTKELRPGAAVTIVGPGGIGKTRLALEAAAESVDEFADGAWFVDLSARREPRDVVVAVAEVLAVPERAGMSLRAAVCESLRRRRVLLVLDNCEHLIDEVADVVEEFLTTSPHLAVLATSREPLGVSGEVVQVLRPLSNDDDALENPAAELFIERAHDAGVDLDLNDVAVRAAIVEICARLDGIPLAIELAGARSASLHPTEMVRRLANRLKLLTGGRRTAAVRQRTLEATIDWSYELLNEPQRTLFRRLGVFTGAFSLDAAEAVAGGDLDVFELLADLVSKSMVNVVGSRYRVLETLREYASVRLYESTDRPNVEEAERARCLALVSDVAAGLKGPDEPVWADRLAYDLDNIRACWRRALAANDAGAALGCFAPLPEFSGLPPHVTQELTTWAEPTIALDGAMSDPLYVGACLWASRGRYNAFDLRGAREWLDRAEAGGPVRRPFAAVLALRRGGLAGLSGAHEAAGRHVAVAKAAADPTVDPYTAVYVEGFELFNLSPRDPDVAAARYPHVLAAAQAVGSPHLVTFIMTSLAELHLFYARPPRVDLSNELAEDALRLAARSRNPQFMSSATSKLAADGRHVDALWMTRENLLRDSLRGYTQQLWWHLRCLLIACHNRQLHHRYAQLMAAIYEGPLAFGLRPTANELDGRHAAVEALGPDVYEHSAAQGRLRDTDAVVQLAVDVIDQLLALADNQLAR